MGIKKGLPQGLSLLPLPLPAPTSPTPSALVAATQEPPLCRALTPGIWRPDASMGDNNTTTAMNAMIYGLVTDLNKQFEAVKEQFVNIDNRLKNIEQGGQTEEAATADRP